MRYTKRALGVMAAAAVCLTGTLAGTATAHAAPARPTSLYAPTELVLTIGKGQTTTNAAVQRAVSLRCTPTPGGDHPAPADACAELNAAQGDFAALVDTHSGRICPDLWNPVVLTAEGVWHGQRVSYSHVYPNACRAQDASRYVFAF
ncbi:MULTISPECIES: subtilase-type protease inhibitor [Streptomycetaceae]|uniref:Probable subtilase-type protease inhibitor n=1 Tax=Streptantibioticus cattleyicolor (strain ATCC 35852 / DSM 46488 / JCM 4925 / NBRC 14057 / NRRL 8057) TaxID=1003195 RepID=F8K0M1_STREN|nr:MULTISPECIES: subtilase-type protease inhibitor [Streptomycetaceae]AEW97428.1 protease inhibitor SIL-V1/SIL-V4 [Streptantibioticus cattleyicolor NRRL 8057 = DSM 46488]MYS61870.1 protease inhibitor protein [Streptomyces sp. SID5468]CCB77750.1 Kexstatin-1 [Streptantibioticus cattleyicolor NRRL 8057 = DSM 46488]